MVKVSLNIVKKVINNLAQTYKEPPVRTLDASEKEQKIYAEILEQSAFDVKMKQASRYAKLLKTILIRPVWRNEKIDLDILTGNLLDIKTGDTPEILEAVLITNYGTTDKVEDITYSYWTPEIWRRLDYRGNIIEEADNPYSILPIIPLFDYGITQQDYSLGDVLRVYLRTMKAAEEEGELYLSVAAAILYEQLGGDFVLSSGTHRMASPTATMALTELFLVFDLDWWKRLQSEFKVVK